MFARDGRGNHIVKRWMLLPLPFAIQSTSVNQRFPSGPTTIPESPPASGTADSRHCPARCYPSDVPTVVRGEPEIAIGADRDVLDIAVRRQHREVLDRSPSGDMRPIALLVVSVNQQFQFGPITMDLEDGT